MMKFSTLIVSIFASGFASASTVTIDYTAELGFDPDGVVGTDRKSVV